ncbi:hypothetical protein MVEN_00444700 [Mycena venus]|uniref:Uncharacterized protein n=1 Tax=Mycena venus TaxID=2733690 RepID=A0A8H7D8X6_9AGAR|nr:hypothetical protein MVEN_00444700 [Mycena venus]
MDSAAHFDTDFRPNSTTDGFASPSYGSAVFANSQHFTVAGGTFTNITKNNIIVASVPSDFRMIPMGDIDLQREILLEKVSGGVDRRCESGWRTVRRVYSAKMNKVCVTVAMYQGDGAEEVERQYSAGVAARRCNICVTPASPLQTFAAYHRLTLCTSHPNVIQIFGTASSGGIHATLFHDDLLPFHHFLDLQGHTHFSIVYIYAYCHADFNAARSYVYSALKQDLSWTGCACWIRRSNNTLCVELNYSGPRLWSYRNHNIADAQGRMTLRASNARAIVTESLTLTEYHGICFNMTQDRIITVALLTTVNLGAVICHSSGKEPKAYIEVASLPHVEAHLGVWDTLGDGVGRIMKDGWTRFTSGDASSSMFWFHACRVHITSNFEDYCTALDLLFVGQSLIRSNSPSYWSLDPLGAQRLRPDEATQLGLPYLQWTIEVEGYFWDASVYAGIRQFHQAKGFDPEGQDVARSLGELLYQISAEMHPADEHSDHEFSQTAEIPSLEDDAEEISAAFKFWMSAQLTLMLFLLLSWLYDMFNG